MSNYTQADFVISQPSIWKGDHSISLSQVIRWKQEHYIVVPEFQRDYVWTDKKLVGWAKTLINQNCIGCIVTYQINGGGANFLADGLQRLTATMRFIQDPISYGFSFGASEAHRFCETFFVTLQHRHYATHFEAMEAFQNLNQGTSLTSSEYYKGVLTLSGRGRLVWDCVPPIVLKMHTGISTLPSESNRKGNSGMQRDAFSLFLQYISGEKGVSLWNVTGIDPSSRRPVENVFMEYVEKNSLSITSIKSHIQSFEKFLEAQTALLRDLINRTGQEGHNMSCVVFRWIMHLSIWRKNTGRPVELYQELVVSLLEWLKDYESIASRFILPNKEGERKKSVTLGTGTLDSLAKLCKAFNVPLYDAPRRSRRKKKAAPGYHVSHIKPFSEHGEGETIIEPAPRNLARGAKPIT